jgi:branched-subunit amino acid transport protein
MTWPTFLIILVISAACTVGARVLPVLLFGGRQLPQGVLNALEYIPVAAFAALVANDLFTPANWSLGVLPNILPLLALVPVVPVALKTKSLWLCILVGVAAYALLKYVIL